MAHAIWTLAYALDYLGRVDEALSVTAQALADTRITGVWAARLATRHAQSLHIAGRYDEAEATARDALTAGERSADRFAVAYALRSLSSVAAVRDRDYAATLGCVDRALDVIGADVATTDLRLVMLNFRRRHWTTSTGRPTPRWPCR